MRECLQTEQVLICRFSRAESIRTMQLRWACSSAGRAPALQPRDAVSVSELTRCKGCSSRNHPSFPVILLVPKMFQSSYENVQVEFPSTEPFWFSARGILPDVFIPPLRMLRTLCASCTVSAASALARRSRSISPNTSPEYAGDQIRVPRPPANKLSRLAFQSKCAECSWLSSSTE